MSTRPMTSSGEPLAWPKLPAHPRLLHGAPADLPIERPTKFELVINMKTAKELGIEVPISMQMLADDGVE